MPLLLPQIQSCVIKAFRLLSTGTPSISTLVLFESDSKTHDTSSIHTSILLNDTAEDLATVQVHYNEAYILGSKVVI